MVRAFVGERGSVQVEGLALRNCAQVLCVHAGVALTLRGCEFVAGECKGCFKFVDEAWVQDMDICKMATAVCVCDAKSVEIQRCVLRGTGWMLSCRARRGSQRG